MSAKEGTVFVLTNDAMPGFVRFDFTTRNDLATRIERINRGELPVPYRLNFAALVPDCALVDRNVRFLFGDYCEKPGSNFFKLNPDILRAAIELAATEVIELSDKEQGISPGERVKMDQIKAYHDAVWFEALNLDAGTKLHFSKNEALTCTAIGNGMVEFDGTEATPAEASAKAMQACGFDWRDVSATEYWIPETNGLNPSSSEHAGPAINRVLRAKHASAENGSGSPIMFVRNNKI
ncbi:GIY-YIG nuclease family protein [Erythrobacter sp. THAF29]|uniref:GIY-YIG nuclease family protein n=1 Tax=Erythrobacter sp. THAF29 TaxID=2587851 RepID=UPI0012681697|nr:GIY-YIG nuclease family protein [Erythrobacter sp. THAF29]QFT77350.1 hypothetical protein FIU90_07320 [Erythrobacter sp. THAF29]